MIKDKLEKTSARQRYVPKSGTPWRKKWGTHNTWGKKTCEKKNNTYEQIGTSFSQMDNITIEK